MTFRHGTNRAAGPDDDAETGGSPTDTEPSDSTSGSIDHETAEPFTETQQLEWRRWIVEQFLTSDYGVVPVETVVETILERDPEDVGRERVRTALTETVLPALDRESVLEYDADRELLIQYGD